MFSPFGDNFTIESSFMLQTEEKTNKFL